MGDPSPFSDSFAVSNPSQTRSASGVCIPKNNKLFGLRAKARRYQKTVKAREVVEKYEIDSDLT